MPHPVGQVAEWVCGLRAMLREWECRRRGNRLAVSSRLGLGHWKGSGSRVVAEVTCARTHESSSGVGSGQLAAAGTTPVGQEGTPAEDAWVMDSS